MDDSFHSMFCPSMCSGKGICDWDAKPAPVCKCYDGSDTSEGCFNSPPNDPNVAFEHFNKSSRRVVEKDTSLMFRKEEKHELYQS